MKALKIIIGILILFVVALLIVTWFLPESSYTERSVRIEAPASSIFQQISDLKLAEAWSPFLTDDTNAVLEYSDVASGLGASYQWTSKQGKGLLTISEIVMDSLVKYNILFDGKRSAYSHYLLTPNQDGSTNVTWGFGVPSLGWPLGRLLGLFMNTGMHPYMDRGLLKLKEIAENAPLEPKGKVMEVVMEDWAGQAIVAIQDSVDMAGMEAFFADSYGKLMEYLGSKGIDVTGAPMSITLYWNETGKSLVEAAMPVEKELKVDAGVQNIYSRTIPASKVVRATHLGPYETVGLSYTAIEEYMTANQLSPAGPPMEIYITDPGTEPDPSLWETRILWPVSPAPTP